MELNFINNNMKGQRMLSVVCLSVSVYGLELTNVEWSGIPTNLTRSCTYLAYPTSCSYLVFNKQLWFYVLFLALAKFVLLFFNKKERKYVRDYEYPARVMSSGTNLMFCT